MERACLGSRFFPKDKEKPPPPPSPPRLHKTLQTTAKSHGQGRLRRPRRQKPGGRVTMHLDEHSVLQAAVPTNMVDKAAAGQAELTLYASCIPERRAIEARGQWKIGAQKAAAATCIVGGDILYISRLLSRLSARKTQSAHHDIGHTSTQRPIII